VVQCGKGGQKLNFEVREAGYDVALHTLSEFFSQAWDGATAGKPGKHCLSPNNPTHRHLQFDFTVPPGTRGRARVFCEDVLGRGAFQIATILTGPQVAGNNGSEGTISPGPGRWIEQDVPSEGTARGRFSWLLTPLPGQVIQVSTIEFVPVR
jgi:hypothetical protein